jgi:hypothetical protein
VFYLDIRVWCLSLFMVYMSSEFQAKTGLTCALNTTTYHYVEQKGCTKIVNVIIHRAEVVLLGWGQIFYIYFTPEHQNMWNFIYDTLKTIKKLHIHNNLWHCSIKWWWLEFNVIIELMCFFVVFFKWYTCTCIWSNTYIMIWMEFEWNINHVNYMCHMSVLGKSHYLML